MTLPLTVRLLAFTVLIVAETGSNACKAGFIEFTDHANFVASTSSISIVNFDSVAKKTILTGNEFAGLTIASRRLTVIAPDDLAPGLTVGLANVNSQPHGISASLFYSGSAIQFDNGNDNFTITLSVPSTSAGLWIGNLGRNNNDPITPTTVSFLDIHGGIIASKSMTQSSAGLIGSGASNRIFYGITSTTPVASFTVANAASDGDGILLDDIQFGAPVPEPSTVTFFVVACAGMIVRQRRSQGRFFVFREARSVAVSQKGN